MSAKNIFKAVAFYFLITILVIGVSIAFGSLYIKEYFSDVKVKSLEKTSNVFVFFGFFVIFVSIFGLYGLFKGVKWILISMATLAFLLFVFMVFLSATLGSLMGYDLSEEMNEIMSEKAEAMHVNQTVIRLQIETFKKLIKCCGVNLGLKLLESSSLLDLESLKSSVIPASAAELDDKEIESSLCKIEVARALLYDTNNYQKKYIQLLNRYYPSPNEYPSFLKTIFIICIISSVFQLMLFLNLFCLIKRVVE